VTNTEDAGETGNSGIEVRSLFPTPLIIARAPMAEEDNNELRDVILAREKSNPGVNHSNMMGWQSPDDFLSWGGETGTKLVSFVQELVDQLTADRAGNRVEIKWFVNAWANVNRQGHANQVHAHPGCLWSGCYYVDDGGAGEDSTLGGELEIRDPRGLAPAMYVPELVPAFTGCENTGGSEILRPRTGWIILFPAWLSHGVRPYLGDGTRISVAFNFALPAGGGNG
jgi:uncharacterized protein (TIGR02466 family)